MTYFPFLGSFFSETLLFFFLPLIISLPTILKYSLRVEDSLFTQDTLKKKIFFIVLRCSQFVLILLLLLDFVLARPFLFSTENLFDLVLYHSGNFFFRHDGFIWFINFFLTSLTLYYLYLVAFVFSRTTPNIAYISEIPALLLCTLLCLRLFIATNDLILMVILLEIAAFCSIIYIGIQSISSTNYSLSIEATIKYFIINAFAVALLIFAICGYFYLTTSTNLIEIVLFFYKYPFSCVFFTEQLILIQLIFFFSYLIKLGAAPLHQWVPDVYEGAETLVTCFLVLLISPALMFKLIIFFKLLTNIPTSLFLLKLVIGGCGALSVLFGTLGAFYQTRIKRFIAYAGLTHLGFMLLGLCFNTVLSYFAFLFYLIIYVVTNLCFFTFLLFSQYYTEKAVRIVYINQLRLYIQTSFFFLLCLIICLFSFAGIPPFAGFFAKFFILGVLVQQAQYALLLFLILSILTGTFMYLRFLKVALFETDPQLAGTSWKVSLQTFFFVLPKTLVAVFADYALHLKSQTIVYKTLILNPWQLWLLTVLVWVLGFLVFFFFFFSVYSSGIFDILLILLTIY
jgi:proton-translocating NADH-quinone oxidoreductase chain N